MLVDGLRGTREAPQASCASLLAPLVAEFGEDRVEIRMYHTPNLTGLKKKLIPVRLNEGWGLQHMKLYGFDDEIILSGYALNFISMGVTQLTGLLVQIYPQTISLTGRIDIMYSPTRISQIIMPEFTMQLIESVIRFFQILILRQDTN